jgi:surfactin synthase thioesterase subunit
LLEVSPSLFEEHGLMQTLLSTIKTDAQLLGRYREAPPLPCPLYALDFRTVTTARMTWQHHTAQSFHLQMFPGKHLFLESDRAQVLQSIVQALSGPDAS